jgi:hypothetical protein
LEELGVSDLGVLVGAGDGPIGGDLGGGRDADQQEKQE